MPRKERVAKVVSDKMDKTRVVTVEDRHSHHRYHKVQVKTLRFKMHDPDNKSRTGDIVRIIESRPFSRDKRWALAEIIKHIDEV